MMLKILKPTYARIALQVNAPSLLIKLFSLIQLSLFIFSLFHKMFGHGNPDWSTCE